MKIFISCLTILALVAGSFSLLAFLADKVFPAPDDPKLLEPGKRKPRRTWLSVGTKTVLFGVHNPVIHGYYVARAWILLFGFTWNPLIWLSFFIHDIGYLGKPNIDGEEGALHPEAAGKLMRLFGRQWENFVVRHSRSYARRQMRHVSRLCYADKYAMLLVPREAFIRRATRSGEIIEYAGLEKVPFGGQHPRIYDWYFKAISGNHTYLLKHCSQYEMKPELHPKRTYC